MEYNFRAIEKKWQQYWKDNKVYKVLNESTKPKYYVLDMFPYPSGAGLHVGHPLGYIASDIYARYKRLQGYNVLHPMGYDAFGLPAEQYALDTGQHPATTTEKNIETFRKQLDNIGFCYDWDRAIKTSDPQYYKWTQWIFLQLFKSWYNTKTNKAERIETLLSIFEQEGNIHHPVQNSTFKIANNTSYFTAEDWKQFDEQTQQAILMEYRLAYCGYGEVNWCEALGTVLANDEVINGVSERGGHPVVKKTLRQWYLRITVYADRLLESLTHLDFSDAMKDMQSNWIGKSTGAEIKFNLIPNPSPQEKGTENHIGFYTNTFEQWKTVKEFAKQNRKASTEAEDIMWQALRNRKLDGHKFRRQHPISGFIPDFVCLEKRLVIEIDGDYHNEKEQKKYDEQRTNFLQQHEYDILRFTNDEVIKSITTVLQSISNFLSKQTNSPSLLERGLGGEVLVYTTRPETIFGADFLVLAPEHKLINQITTPEQKGAIENYTTYIKSRSERERMAEKKISGCFTGSYAIHPFTQKQIPIWISEYVLASYGTGAIMAVPCADERDHKFAKHFNIPITNIIDDVYDGEETNATKEKHLINSLFLNGLTMQQASEVAIQKIKQLGIGKQKINYKFRDAAFSRQRYWGEPFPIVWKNGIPYPLNENELPLELPHVDSYKPGPEGEGPLSNIPEWIAKHLETNTMPGYAGSSWYFLRYMDPHNTEIFCNKKVSDYWNQVDVYVGGTEHAVGHLLYSRMWTKVLYDLGYINFDEPFKKLVNQGMIQGSSRFVYRILWQGVFSSDFDTSALPAIFISKKYQNALLHSQDEIIQALHEKLSQILKKRKIDFIPNFSTTALHIDVHTVDGIELNIELLRKWRPESEYANAEFILEDKKYICGTEVEKMSKSKFNTVNPDDIIEKYGADTFRMYEMFLGPIEQSKPWDTKGIEGVHRFLKKLWRLFYDEEKQLCTNEKATQEELKILHKTIKKVQEDTERFSYNTAVSAFMICVNELTALNVHKKQILEPLLIMLTPYAPHIAEELWHALGNTTNIIDTSYPILQEKYIIENTKNYPVAINGKSRTDISIALNASQEQVEQIVLSNETIQKWLEGKVPKKIIYVQGRMINIVL